MSRQRDDFIKAVDCALSSDLHVDNYKSLFAYLVGYHLVPASTVERWQRELVRRARDPLGELQGTTPP